jgi:anti-sigma factor RsiW
MTERPYLPCKEIISFLADYLDRQLPPETLFEFERHLAVCASCVAYLASYRETILLAKSTAEPLPEGPPDDLIRAILAALEC